MAIKKDRKKGGEKKRVKSEFDQQLLDLARVTRVVKGGRRFRFRATVVIGNRKGKVGVGVAKGADVSQAIQKAVADAKKAMITVVLAGKSISHDVTCKLGSAKVLLKPTKEGRGIIAGGAVRSVVELVGIHDIVAKSQGCSNKLNVARAAIGALKQLQLPREDVKKGVIKEEVVVAEKKNETVPVSEAKTVKKTVKKAVKKTVQKVAKKTVK